MRGASFWDLEIGTKKRGKKKDPDGDAPALLNGSSVLDLLLTRHRLVGNNKRGGITGGEKILEKKTTLLWKFLPKVKPTTSNLWSEKEKRRVKERSKPETISSVGASTREKQQKRALFLRTADRSGGR